MRAREILLFLIRTATGWESIDKIPEDVDWDEVFRLAEWQGVLPLLADGYDVYLKNHPEGKDLKKTDDGDKWIQLVGGVYWNEIVYHQHKVALKELSRLLASEDVSFLLMKGIACGLFYPIPKHRPCGDIDIYAGGRFDEINRILI